MIKRNTGERLEFYDFSDVTIEHLHRYAVAQDFVYNKTILDIASGEGYGTSILATKALKVIGVDIDEEAVLLASKKYVRDNLNFIIGSADNIPVETSSVDVVVSFETIEHHDKHDEMFSEIKRVLKPGGVLIMSSPDKKYYSDIPGFKNKFHIKELYFEQFEDLVNKNFKISKFYLQKSYNFNSIIANPTDFNKIKIYSGDQNNICQNENTHLYILTVASDNGFQDLSLSIFNGLDITNIKRENDFSEKINEIKSTNSYKVGNFLLRPLFYLKRILNR